MTKRAVRLGAAVVIIGLLLSAIIGSKTAYANDLIPKVDKIIKEYDTVYEGDTQALDILIKGREKVQYKVWLNNKKTGTWDDISKGFSEPVESNRVYNVVLPKLNEADYRVTVWVKRAGQTPLNKSGYDSYSFIDFSCLKNEGPSSKINIDELKSNYSIGDTIEIKKEEDKQYLYKYKVINAINNKELVSYKDYADSLSWKAAGQGLYLMKISVKYTEKVEVPKPTVEEPIVEEAIDETVKSEEDNTESLNDEDEGSAIEDVGVNEEIEADEPKDQIEYKDVERELEINKLIMVGDPFKYVGPTAPAINSLAVGNVGEGSRIYIKAQASASSKNVGYIYGSLHGVKILKQVGKFYYIEATDYASLKTVKGYVYTWQLKTVKPSGAYSLVVDLSDQRVYIFKGKDLLKTIICSTGLDGTPTPTGTYLVGDRGPYFYTGYKNSTVCYNWVRINNNFLFHSVLFNTKGQVYEAEAAKLGTKASHGCIRVPLDESKWIYDNISRGSLVVIQE